MSPVATIVTAAGPLALTVATWRMFAPAAPLPMDVTAGKLPFVHKCAEPSLTIAIVAHHRSPVEEEEAAAARTQTLTTLVPATQAPTSS